LWNDLLKIKDLYLKGRVMKIGNGEIQISGGTLGVTLSH
jgi:hypothetical protein